MIKKITYCVILLVLFLRPRFNWAQEDVASNEELLIEQENINFQTFFFEALQQKAIENYDKAIYALEACYNIDKESVAVLFELSKNYVLLLKYTEAEYYILKALEFQPTNIYLLEHLREIKSKQNDYESAILIQNKIILQKPETESDLVFLYIKSGKIDKAIELLKKLDEKDSLPSHLVALKKSLTKEDYTEEEEPTPIYMEQPKSKLDNLKDNYNLKKDYSSLKLVLERELKTKQYLQLLEDSRKGLDLYPAQPFIYLMNAVALNSLRKYSNAIEILNTGLDYLVDDDKLKSQFMEQLSLSYKGLGNNKKATEYYNQAIELRNK